MALIDTSIVIDFLAGEEKIVAAVHAVAKKGAIRTTVITEYELLKHRNGLQREIAEKFLSVITVYPFDRASAKQAALLFEKLLKNGTMINENDLLIAGIALANNEILLTRDKKFAFLKEESIQII